MTDEKNKTNFGYQEVNVEDKQSLVGGVFDKVATNYDIMNDIMSAGLHRVWKTLMVNQIGITNNTQPKHLLDVAGGTGDIAYRAMKRARRHHHPLDVTVLDINFNMLKVGKKRMSQKIMGSDIRFLAGNAEMLPFEDNSVDAYSIAFGIRNVTHIDKALKEAYRVLKPGGQFLCLEFSHVTLDKVDKLYDMWSFYAIPRIGKFIAGDDEPYQYLVESIRRFPKAEDFAIMIEEAGFARVKFDRLTAGVAALHQAWCP